MKEKITTKEEFLWDNFKISASTKYHSYDYLYKSMLKSMDEWIDFKIK